MLLPFIGNNLNINAIVESNEHLYYLISLKRLLNGLFENFLFLKARYQ